MKTPELIISLATYPKRFFYLRRTLDSILHQTFIDMVSKIYINVDDNLTEKDYEKYDSLKKFSSKIEIKVCPAKWRSANKLIWVYKEHHDDVIVCFDDDKDYPLTSLERLYTEWLKHQNCIVAEEVNPYTIDEVGLKYIDDVDLKLKQRAFAKYLSNNCLFCPNCFDESILYDYDNFMYVTQGNHDELWFWIASTIKGVQTIGLDFTYACYVDGIWMKDGDSDLYKINSDDNVRNRYYTRMNEKYGKRMIEKIYSMPVSFDFNNENKMAIIGNIDEIHSMYSMFPIEFRIDNSIRKSWVWHLKTELGKRRWFSCKIIS